MTDFDPLTPARLQYLVPGASADDYVEAITALVTDVGSDVLSREGLQPSTKLRTALAVNDIPLAMIALVRMLSAIAPTEEKRENLTFLVTKVVDDALNLGAFYMAGRSEDHLPKIVDVRQAGRAGGKSTGVKNQNTAQKHKDILQPILNSLRESNPNWLDAELIRAAIKSYGDRRPVLPGERQIGNYLAQFIKEGKVPEGPKDGRARKK